MSDGQNSNSDNESFMIMSISSQNTTFIILTTLMLIATKKEHKRFLNISFDFELLEDSITFINHISRRDKFKRLKHSSFIIQNKFKRLRSFTFIIFLNIF